MSKRKLLTAAVAAMGLMGAITVSAEEPKRTFGEYTDDTMLLGKVKSALAGDDTTEANEINVEVNKGIVQLNGFVDTAKEKAQATTVAQAVKGVKQVENNLIVKGESTSTGQSMDDSTVTARVNTALIDSKETKAGDIKVQTYDGVVQLSGFVDNEAQKSAATKVAQSVKGVKSVQNNLSVKGH
ncbi:MAG TPA: BON domain-containing protein [Steroidobacteraceae bacterium]